MTEKELEKLKYPIGKFTKPVKLTVDVRKQCIDTIEAFPLRLRAAVAGLNDEQLETPYRPDGWTIRQVVHHLADSHMNAFTRFKLTLTEDRPTIKPYREERWAMTPDVKSMPLEAGIALLEGLHARWSFLLRSMTEVDMKKTFIHPERSAEISLEEYLPLYAWHCNHHLAHITSLKKSKSWK